MLKKIIWKIVPDKYLKQLKNFKILALEYGQFKTIEKWECIDKEGNKIPWYTYPAIEYLSGIDFSQKKILEFGSGNSSTYWSKKANSVISVEHDNSWFQKINGSNHSNNILILSENDYENDSRIKELDILFDVVVIDGIRRAECATVVKQYLNLNSDEGFMVILDNSDWYPETSKFLRESLNSIQIDFHGFGPINCYTSTTSIFLSRNFNFNSLNNCQPHPSISGVRQIFG